MNRTIAKKTDWNTEDMPKARDTFVLNRHFTEEEIETLKFGNIPQAMEDKWFWYYEDDKLYAHRSWTGICIYIIAFDFASDNHLVTVNRDKKQYTNTNAEDIKILNRLLDWWAQPKYDYYNEWIEETVTAIRKSSDSSAQHGK